MPGTEIQAGINRRPEIEFTVCDIWPEMCSIGEQEWRRELIDVCALVPEHCTARDADITRVLAGNAFMERSTELCRIDPDACQVTDLDTHLEPVQISLCDTYPDLCTNSTVHSAEFVELSPCVLAPERCEIVNLDQITESFQRIGQ